MLHYTHDFSGPKGNKTQQNNNSHGPDKLNIRPLKHIGPLGIAFLTSMFKTALNKNLIPHTWQLANIVPIPKPNKDTNKGTSYRSISLLSVIADTGDMCLSSISVLSSNTFNNHYLCDFIWFAKVDLC